MKSVATIVISILILAACSTVQAATWNVPAGAPTIQAGIDSASVGDTVLVACGTYYEHTILMKSGVTLLSETGEPDCVTVDAQSLGRVIYCQNVDAAARIEGFTITGGSENTGGGAYFTSSHPTCINCAFVNNTAAALGGGVQCTFSSGTIFESCTFSGNTAHSGAGLWCLNSSTPTLNHCTFYNNSAQRGGAIYSASPLTLNNCTLSGNTATESGGGIYRWQSSFVLNNTIISFSTQGHAVYCWEDTGATLNCCDVFGNAGGDWVGCIAAQYGINGNISAAPMFCDAGIGDFEINSQSPCLNAVGCGLIGAESVGCGVRIATIIDVGNDQGRQVHVAWARSKYDGAAKDTTITHYSLWRRLDQYMLENGQYEPENLFTGRGYPPGQWEFVKTVPAYGEETYATVCATLCDSTVAGGMCWSVFFVRAGTDVPTIYFDSPPDSGYSVDNLEPQVPQGLTAEQDGEAIVLHWDESSEEDFNFYAVYRGEESGFPLGDPIGYSTTPMYTDSDLPGPDEYWYRITATDFSGNESSASNEASAATTGVASETAVPTAFFLGSAVPNPFNPVTEVTYGIPAGSTPSRVVMNVYDATGREVTTLVDAEQGPGTYRVVWDGRDHKGSDVASGVYFYRICWNGRSQTKRTVLLK